MQDQVIAEFKWDALPLRCWMKIQQTLGVSPCLVLSELNDRYFPASCELDVGNAIEMRALSLASGTASTRLDWNNNYGDDENKCVLFHCGPGPQTLMTKAGQVTDHAILVTSLGKGASWGCNTGRISATPFIYSSMLTDSGELKFYVGQGKFTSDKTPNDFFGCAGVAQTPKPQKMLRTIGYVRHRHHVSVTPGHVAAPVIDAFTRYLGYEVRTV